MKKTKHIALGLLIAIPFLSSCGGGMDDWPYCDLPDAVASYETITIEMIQYSFYEDDEPPEIHKYFSDSPEMVLGFYNRIELLHVAPEKTERTFEKYWQKVSIIFEKEELSYTFEYYEIYITDGYFVFNHEGIYAFKADFYSVIKTKVEKNLDKLTEL